MRSVSAFIEARDILLRHRDDYDRACSEFHWPQLGEFNWALDYFDAYAQGNDTLALWIVEENGGEAKLSYAEMSARSNQVVNFLRAVGVRRGERILIMLPN